MKVVWDVLRIVAAVIVVVIGTERPNDGPAKKGEALSRIKSVMAEPGGVEVPPYLQPYQDWFLGLVIDSVVVWMNRNGWDAKG